jgi:hypothetical protein
MQEHYRTMPLGYILTSGGFSISPLILLSPAKSQMVTIIIIILKLIHNNEKGFHLSDPFT